MNKLYATATANPKAVAVLIITLIVSIVSLCGIGYYAWQKHADVAEKLQQAIVLNEQQAFDRINASDPTLPPQALEKTDRTVVVANTNKTPASNYDVGFFKVNNYRAWEWGIGFGKHGGDRYIPVELQQNFSKDAAVSVEYHYGGHDPGWEVKYKLKTDKLFGLF